MLEGFRHLEGYFDNRAQGQLVAAVREIVAQAPLYEPVMPRTGKPLSVKMTNAGALGWVTDKENGYRYQAVHPVTGAPWPAMPKILTDLWDDAAFWPGKPEACLINFYGQKARMGSHVDADEKAVDAPVVSVSLGDEAIFHIGGHKRSDPKTRMTLRSGDVVVLGGAARRAYHGVDRVKSGTSTLLKEGGRFNLTMRRVNPL